MANPPQDVHKFKDLLETFIGYPCNTANDFTEMIDSFKYTINNVGDPFGTTLFRSNTHEEERYVLDFFAKLWGIPATNYWGYVTSSGTEGNLQGLYVGREVFPNAIFYTSAESHYSIFKIARLLKLQLCIISTHENGEMNYDDFENKLQQNIEYPVLINANIGTTMKGAIDNTREIYRILQKYKKHHDYYLHMDGALMGFIIPFLEQDISFMRHANSVSISGHKFLGVPFPCGVFLMEQRFIQMIRNPVEYIGSNDCTISGSRNGHSVLMLKYIIDKKKDEFKNMIHQCFENAEYLLNELDEKCPDLNAWRNQNSITVVIKRPKNEMITKWQLATQDNISHVIVLPHVTKEKLDAFIQDLLQ
jgi:histidine decarboxylase